MKSRRVYAIVPATNVRSAKLFEKIGVVREGIFLRTHRFERSWSDVWCYSLLREEFNG